MNAERLLAHFERISEAPDAITRLRRFILDLAVRGKLVEQDPEDEPVAQSLGLINIERLAKRDFFVPPSWDWVAVGDVSESRLGKMLDKGKNKGIERPYLRNLNVRWFDFVLSDLLEMRFEDSELPEYVLKRGDVLICEGGEPGRAAVWDERIEGVYFQKAIHRVRFADFVSPVYFVYALRSSADDGRLSNYFTGTGISHFTGRGLKSYRFPLPPLAEQHRIVAKVDELMAICDLLEAARQQRQQGRERLVSATLQRLNQPAEDPASFRQDASFALQVLPSLTTTPAQIKQLRQTILNLAVRGKLVEQDPEDEPAEELLQRLKPAKALAYELEGLRSRQPISAVNQDDLLIKIPAGWGIPSFNDVFVIVSGVTKGQRIHPSELVDVPYLRVANVQRGSLDLSQVKTIGVRKADVERYRLKDQDILMTEGGDWDKLGRAAIWADQIPGCIHQNHVFRLRVPTDDLMPNWVVLYANSAPGRKFFENCSKQTTNLASINMTQLRSCPLPLPPLAEQHRIVAKVDELMALCDQLEMQLNQADQQRRRLLEAVLAEALVEPKRAAALGGMT